MVAHLHLHTCINQRYLPKNGGSATYPDAAEAGVAHEGDLEAGAGGVEIDGRAEADDGDDVEVVEHACRRAQGLAAVVVRLAEGPISAASVYRKRRRRQSEGAGGAMGTHPCYGTRDCYAQ